MTDRFFINPYPDYTGQDFQINTDQIKDLITNYVRIILENTTPGVNEDRRGDLYVGDAGIAYMFWKLSQSKKLPELNNQIHPLEYAQTYIRTAKKNAKFYSKSKDDRCAFLCGNAGIYAVAAVISSTCKDKNELQQDLQHFQSGFEPLKTMNFSKYGSDEILVGRAGYLSGCYWLNRMINPKPFDDNAIVDLCQIMVDSGREYARKHHSAMPLMYQYHGTEYLGAAHGLCSILHMMLESPWFYRPSGTGEFTNISKTKLSDIKCTIDAFLALQEECGNFPCTMDDVVNRRESYLVHWCHGAPGAIYLLIKSYLLFNEEIYLNACVKAANFIWVTGLLNKGPGICHGVAGNAYVFLMLYRLTNDLKYLYRATKFMEFLTNEQFLKFARKPDCPSSLYEGLAGTICFLCDLAEPQQAEFPFMNVF